MNKMLIIRQNMKNIFVILAMSLSIVACDNKANEYKQAFTEGCQKYRTGRYCECLYNDILKEYSAEKFIYIYFEKGDDIIQYNQLMEYIDKSIEKCNVEL